MKKSVSPDKKKSKTLLKQYGARLLPQHAKLLAASAINPKVARQRGYRSVTAKAPLRKLGFGQAQCRVPALLVPIRDVHGKLAAHQIRPDEPRKNRDGKPIKYESPTGSRPVLDVPRRVRRWLGDPQRPLFITEGARKADAAASRKLACLSVAGVFGWRGKNTFDGKTVLADWESIALQGRRIYLTFDSDVIEKRPVYDALVRLRGFLASKGADVLVIYLPPGEGGAKCGLDDYFAAGHSVRDLLHLAAAELRRPPSTDLAQYFIDNRRICRRGRANGDLVAEPLCNFTAKIVEERILDDGQDPVRRLVLKGRLCTGTRLPRTEVDAAEFPGLTWVPIRWGTSAIINAGANCRDHLRAAIQELSSPTVKHIFVHTGLRKIGKQRVFLHGRGAIGIRGIAPDLPPELQRYYLPHPPADPAKHVRRSLGLLTLAPLDVTVPLLAAMYRAPTASLLPPDFTLWLEGPSSSLKSTLSALFLSHFGDFDHEHLPANWESTANSLERRAFVLKDLPLIIDDYAPGGGNHREIEGKASRILRSVGNRSARGRLAVNLKERQRKSVV